MSVARALWETCDLAAKWEVDAALRARVRTKHTLVLRSVSDGSTLNGCCAVVERTTANCRLNKTVLFPILNHMNLVQLKLPPIERLLLACEEFFKMCNCQLPQTHVYQNAWGLRRLSQLVKSKIYKPDPPKETGRKWSFIYVF